MTPSSIICRYNLLNVLGKLSLKRSCFYAEIFRRRYKGLKLTETGAAVGITQTIDRFGRMI